MNFWMLCAPACKSNLNHFLPQLKPTSKVLAEIFLHVCFVKWPSFYAIVFAHFYFNICTKTLC